MPVRGLGHVNLRATAAVIAQLRRFYRDVIGLDAGLRPTFRSGSRGYWLYAGGHAVLHLTIGTDGDTALQPSGPFNHVAFDCDDLDAMRGRLDAAGVDYQTDVVDALQQTQLFLRDPAGIGVELTFRHTPGN